MPVRRIVRGQRVAPAKRIAARNMRRVPTPEEALVWQRVRANQFGVHVRRQQVIDGFIVDFYFHKSALVVEIDGDAHSDDTQAAYDAERDRLLSGRGLRVLRFSNALVRDALDVVLRQISDALAG
jgi:very-short-patch-repair endonuclease